MINNLITSLYQTFVYKDRYLYFLEGLGTTMILTFCSFILATLIALVLCVLARSKVKALSTPANLFIQVTEQIPATVMLLLMVYVVFRQVAVELLIV